MFDHVGFGFSDKPLEVNSNQSILITNLKSKYNNKNEKSKYSFNIFQNYTYSLIDQAENAVSLWEELGIKRAHIVSHDMGDSVLTEVITLKEKNMLDGKLNKDFFRVVEDILFLIILLIDYDIRVQRIINNIEYQFYISMIIRYIVFKEFTLAIFVKQSVTFTNGGMHYAQIGFRLAQRLLMYPSIGSVIQKFRNLLQTFGYVSKERINRY